MIFMRTIELGNNSKSIVVRKTTLHLKIILLIVTTITRALVTEEVIRSITEVVYKIMTTVIKMTYKANNMGKKV